jgi:hypothetical protein
MTRSLLQPKIQPEIELEACGLNLWAELCYFSVDGCGWEFWSLVVLVLYYTDESTPEPRPGGMMN